MTSQITRYWYNHDTKTIHESSCTNCLMTFDGHEKSGWERRQRENWWGPYETKGAAVDVGLSHSGEVYECGMGCHPKRINP